MSGRASRIGADFKHSKQELLTRATISAETEHVIDAVSMTSRRPVFLTELKIVSQPMGLMHCRSIRSNEIPCSFRKSAACIASATIYDIVTIVRSSPVPANLQVPNGSV